MKCQGCCCALTQVDNPWTFGLFPSFLCFHLKKKKKKPFHFRLCKKCPCSEEGGGDLLCSVPHPAHAQLLPQLRHDGQLLHLHRAALQAGHRQDGHGIHEGRQLGQLPEIQPRGKRKINGYFRLTLK